MFDTVRWMLHLGWPKRISSEGGIFVQKEGKSNIADTQSAVFEYDELNCVWQHRTWGTPADPITPGRLRCMVTRARCAQVRCDTIFTPVGEGGTKIHKDVVYEKEKYPEDLTEDHIELNAAPATRLHMLNFLTAIEKSGRPVADIEEGHISTASCILANLAMKTGRPVVYDPKTRQIIGDPEANGRLQRVYRQPWAHPDPTTV